MLLGIYKNYEELEENLTIDELDRMVRAEHKRSRDNHRFLAGLKGIKLKTDEELEYEAEVERVQEKAREKLRKQRGDEYMDKAGLNRLKSIISVEE